MNKETKDKRSSSESEIQDDLGKVSGEVINFLDKRYPISMNLLRKIFRRVSQRSLNPSRFPNYSITCNETCFSA